MIARLRAIYKRYWITEPDSAFGIGGYKLFCGLLYFAYRVRYQSILRIGKKTVLNIISERRTDQRSCFVFANGPSVSDIDFKKIKKLQETRGYDILAINSFLSKSESLVPNFAIFADYIYFTKNERIEDVESDFFKTVSYCNDLGIKCFVPAQHINNSRFADSVPFCAFSSIYSNKVKNIFTNTGYYPLTALYALTLAVTLKYRNIYICGFDNNYFLNYEVDNLGHCVLRHIHYYDKEQSNTEVKHIKGDTASIFFDIYRHFKFLEKIGRQNKNIFNVAKTTYTDAFERKLDLDIYIDNEP